MLPSEIKLHVGVGVESTQQVSNISGSRLLRSGNGFYSSLEKRLGTYFLINENKGAPLLFVPLVCSPVAAV